MNERHRFAPKRKKYTKLTNGTDWDRQVCGICDKPRTDEAHPYAYRGALGHRGTDPYDMCYDPSHWAKTGA